MINISEIVAKTEAMELICFFVTAFKHSKKSPLHNRLSALQWWLFVRTFEVVTQIILCFRKSLSSHSKMDALFCCPFLERSVSDEPL